MPALPPPTRRSFLKSAAALSAIASAAPRGLLADPLGLPLGLQLYSVRELLPADYDGTLRKLAALGYREVEAAGYFGHAAANVKQSMAAAGLRCVSAHYPLAELQPKLDETIRFGSELGLDYIICSSPALKDPTRLKNPGYRSSMEALTLDDWRWNADQFNAIGKRVKSAGMQFGYHNHTVEFGNEKGVVFYDELLRLTDPATVTMEMDCGWVVVGGKSPVEYLTKYPGRFSMLHVKDFKLGKPATEFEPPPSAELGQGGIDYKAIFQAAKGAGVKHYFVEQEQFDMAPFDALKIDADYMQRLAV